MNTKSVDLLKLSAETGNIDLLYEVIHDDPSIFENIDKNQFVDTPFHIAASKGYLDFAVEIMNLKPSFATKLNLQGCSPIHVAMNRLAHLVMERLTRYLAMDNPTLLAMDRCILLQRAMVSYLVGINKDLVRVKGREGLTPLHIACKNGEVDLLAEFLTACPDSIEDVTVRGESALHIAVINHQFNALQVLVGWLKENFQAGARKLEEKILNQKDIAGNTVLHISALSDDPKFLGFLVKTGIKLDEQNLENQTALDVARSPEMKKIILVKAKAKHGSEIRKVQTRAEELSSKTTIIDYLITCMRRLRKNISEEQRNIWLIVTTLVATATYESVLNPPGGVFQVSASDDNKVKIMSTVSYYSTRGNAGKSILSKSSFAVFSVANLISFYMSTLVMVILTPTEPLGRLLFGTIEWFVVCYLIALLAISPTHANTTILYIFISLIASNVLTLEILSEYFDYKQSKKLIIPDLYSIFQGYVRELRN